MTVIPAHNLDRAPKFRYAVLSVRKDAGTAELESSFASLGYAQGLFERQYSKWGFTDTNFYLVDWDTKAVLQTHVVF